MARAPMTPADVAKIVDEQLRSPRPADGWIGLLTLEQAVAECERRGLATSGSLNVIKERLRKYERAAFESVDRPLEPVCDLPSEEDLRLLARVAVSRAEEVRTSTPGHHGAVLRSPPRTRRGESVAREAGEWSRRPEGGFGSARRREDNDSRSAGTALKLLRQWSVTFSGVRGSDADAFLERIREGRRLVAVSDRELLDSLPFVLGGVAVLWYRAWRLSWRTWADFEHAFRSRFAAPNFQLELNKEIIRRTQGENEPVADYISCMMTLFARLNPPWPVEKQLDYTHSNLLPRYQISLNRDDFADFRVLEMLAGDAETKYISVGRYRPPPPPERSLLPSAAYQPPARGVRSRGTAAALEGPDAGYDQGFATSSGETAGQAYGLPEPLAAVMTGDREIARDVTERDRGVARRTDRSASPGRRGGRNDRAQNIDTGRTEPRRDRGEASERRGPRREPSRSNTSERTRPNKCWRCGREGHFRRECPEPPKQHCKCCKCAPPPAKESTEGAGNEERRQ